MKESNTRNSAGPMAVSRVLALLANLSEHSEGHTLTELSKELSTAKSTLRNMLVPLVGDGFLIQRGGYYQLGPASCALAGKILSAWTNADILRYYLRKLAHGTNESVAIARLDMNRAAAFFTESLESTHSVRYVIQPGRTAPLHASASGKALLAFAPDFFLEEFLASKAFSPVTALSITKPSELKRELSQIRAEGLAMSLGESVEDGAALAAPVTSPSGRVDIAMVIAGPRARIEPKLEFLKSELLAAARAASGQFQEPGQDPELKEG